MYIKKASALFLCSKKSTKSNLPRMNITCTSKMRLCVYQKCMLFFRKCCCARYGRPLVGRLADTAHWDKMGWILDLDNFLSPWFWFDGKENDWISKIRVCYKKNRYFLIICWKNNVLCNENHGKKEHFDILGCPSPIILRDGHFVPAHPDNPS